jgi:orotate phosphoribosyltransferase
MGDRKMLNKMKEFIQKNCILKGNFALSNGGSSSIYFDMKRALLNVKFIAPFLQYFSIHIKPDYRLIDGIGGYGMGAALMIPNLLLTGLKGEPLKGFLVRESKEHGTQNYIENKQEAPQTILIIDDVLTTGRSLSIAASAFKDVGYKISGFFVLVNRADKKTTAELKKKLQYPMHLLFHADEFKT